MPRAPLAALLCLALAAPAPAQVRAAAARVPAAAVFTPALGGSRLLAQPGVTLSAPSLGAPALSPSPSLAAAPLALPAPSLAPAAPLAAAGLAPARAASRAGSPAAPFAAAAPFSAALTAANEAPVSSPELGRAALETPWTGAVARPGDVDAAVPGRASAPAPLSRPSPAAKRRALSGALALPALAAASGGGLLAATGGLLAAAMPFLQAGGLLLGAYTAARLSRWVVGKLAARYGWSKNTLTLARFVVGAGIWGAAGGYALSLIGVSDNAILTTFGGSGAAMALAVKDIVGNLVHGVHFLFTRPFTVGTRVTIDDVPGTVHELTLRYVVIKTDLQPPYVYYTYSELVGKAVTVHARYETKAARLKLRRPALPRGLLGALRDAATPRLWRPAVFSALGVAALSLLPLARGWFAHKGIVAWFEMLLPWAQFGLILFLGRSLSQAAQGAIARLAQRYAWSAPSTTLVKLGTSVLIWSVAGSFALNAVGVSWASLATTLSISTVILGIAVNDYVTATFQAFLILVLKPFQIGDRVAVGKHEGEVLDINFQHVVLQKDADSHILLPYASVKGFRSPREHGAKANEQ